MKRLLTILLLLPALVLPGCKKPQFSQETPEAVVASAVAMISQNQAHRLSDLIYSDDLYQRAFLRRVGSLLGHMQELASELNRAFPRDIEALREQTQAKAQAAIKAAGAQNAFSTLFSRNSSGEQREAAMQDTIRGIFADPFSWAQDASERVSFEKLNDDLVAVLWDGRPVPPFGLTMRKSEDKWYVVLPTNIPFVARYLPQTKDDWNLFASVVKILDNAVIDLTADVKNGRVVSFNDMARKAGEKVFMPGALAYAAIAKHYEMKFKKPKETPAAATAGSGQ